MTPHEIKDCIAAWREERDNIAREFSGVRPSYLSTDLAILEERIERYKRMLEEMTDGNDT